MGVLQIWRMHKKQTSIFYFLTPPPCSCEKWTVLFYLLNAYILLEKQIKEMPLDTPPPPPSPLRTLFPSKILHNYILAIFLWGPACTFRHTRWTQIFQIHFIHWMCILAFRKICRRGIVIRCKLQIFSSVERHEIHPLNNLLLFIRSYILVLRLHYGQRKKRTRNTVSIPQNKIYQHTTDNFCKLFQSISS